MPSEESWMPRPIEIYIRYLKRKLKKQINTTFFKFCNTVDLRMESTDENLSVVVVLEQRLSGLINKVYANFITEVNKCVTCASEECSSSSKVNELARHLKTVHAVKGLT